jgi:hypothetical protein
MTFAAHAIARHVMYWKQIFAALRMFDFSRIAWKIVPAMIPATNAYHASPATIRT